MYCVSIVCLVLSCMCLVCVLYVCCLFLTSQKFKKIDLKTTPNLTNLTNFFILFDNMIATKSYLPSAKDAPNNLPYNEIEAYLMNVPDLTLMTRQQYRSRLRSIRTQYDNTNHFMDIITVACEEKRFRTNNSASPYYYKGCAMVMRKIIDFSWVKETLHKHNLYSEVIDLINKLRNYPVSSTEPTPTSTAFTTENESPPESSKMQNITYYQNCTIIYYGNTKSPVVKVDTFTQT